MKTSVSRACFPPGTTSPIFANARVHICIYGGGLYVTEAGDGRAEACALVTPHTWRVLKTRRADEASFTVLIDSPG